MPLDDTPDNTPGVTLSAEVIGELLDVDETTLSADTALDAIDGWDSVNALRVLVHLERETGHEIDYAAFAGAETVGALDAVVTAGAPS